MPEQIKLAIVWLLIAAGLITAGSYGVARFVRALREDFSLASALTLIAGLIACIAFVLAGGCFGVFGVGMLRG